MKVSVIVPVFNAEKFLGACLESLLAQTLKDFEVLVVDDCSTDSSATIVENFLERFDGRLKLLRTEKNSGSGAVPRNVGLEHAQGKYICFVDADDLLTPAALETLYDFAEDYQADVVSMNVGLICDAEPIPKKFGERKWLLEFSDKIFLDDDFEERLKKFFNSQYELVPWSRFLRRKILIDNEITFPAMKISEDVIWNLKLIFSAKSWLRINVPLYVQRYVPESISRRRRSPEETITFYTSPLINGLECLDEFMREKKFFKENPLTRFRILNFFVLTLCDKMSDALKKISPLEIYEIFLREFSAAGSTQPALISYLLITLSLQREEPRK